MAARETENNAYAKFLGDKRRALWYVMVFSGVVNWQMHARASFCKADSAHQKRSIARGSIGPDNILLSLPGE